jgi:hypothetical protein
MENPQQKNRRWDTQTAVLFERRAKTAAPTIVEEENISIKLPGPRLP